MYEFGILLFAGLAVAKTVDVFRHLTKGMHRSAVLVGAMVVGVAYAFVFDFSVFAAWGVPVRADWIGTLATGVFMAGIAGGWHELLGVLWAHRYHGETTAIEARLDRAA